MPRGHPWTHCKRCSKTRESCGGLTRTGLCITCSNEIKEENLVSLVTRTGPYFEHWYARCRAAFEFDRSEAKRSTAR